MSSLFAFTGGRPHIRRDGTAWIPDTADQPILTQDSWSYSTSLSTSGLITGTVLQSSGSGIFQYSWSLDLNTGEYHVDKRDVSGVPCPGHVVEVGVAPLLLKVCPDSAVPTGWVREVGSCPVPCSWSAFHGIVNLTADGQGGTLQLTLQNGTPDACDFLLISDAPSKAPLDIRDQSGASAALWHLPGDSETRIDLSITGARNPYCQPFVVGLSVLVVPSPVSFPRMPVIWDPQPATFNAMTGTFSCPSLRVIPPPSPHHFNPVSWGNPYPDVRQ